MKFTLNTRYIIYCLISISLLSALRNLFLPLFGDELEYVETAKNIITKGQYYSYGIPSTFTPSLPLLVSLFYSQSEPILGFMAAKFFNFILMLIGLRFLHLFLKKLNISPEIALIIIMLTVVNCNFVNWSAAIYPESILFCFLWIFLNYIVEDIKKPTQVLYVLVPFIVLLITRYLYGVFIFIVAYMLLKYILELYKNKDFNSIYKVVILTICCMLPVLLWFKYVYNVEHNVDINQNYFTRFKEHDAFYNIKAGLGLIQHSEVGKINGLPAFVSLFVPIMGFRNWIISVLLIATFCFGFISKWKIKELRLLFIVILLIMFGLILAGTGFNRYWLVLLPGFWVGFYLFFKHFNFKDTYFVKLSILLAIVYVINELRLDYLILSKI